MKRYTNLLTQLRIHEKTITKEQLFEFREFLGFLLSRITEEEIISYTQEITTKFGLKQGLIDSDIAFIKAHLVEKARLLMSMDSVGFSGSTGSSEYVEFTSSDTPEAEIPFPQFLQRAGVKNLTSKEAWLDVHGLIELIGLLIVQKELIAEKTIEISRASLSKPVHLTRMQVRDTIGR